jgi:hypothetical protein
MTKQSTSQPWPQSCYTATAHTHRDTIQHTTTTRKTNNIKIENTAFIHPPLLHHRLERPTHHPSLNKGSYKTNQPPSIVQANAHQPHPDSFINIPITLKMPSKRKQPPNKEKKSKKGKRNQKKKIDAAASFFSVQAKAKVRQIENHASLCKKFAAMHFTARARFNASLRI